MRIAPRFAIVFDRPNRDPLFATRTTNGYALSMRLENCARFESEASAERTLHTSFGPSIAEWGSVVEMAE